MFSKQKLRTSQIPIVLLERKMVANRTQSVWAKKWFLGGEEGGTNPGMRESDMLQGIRGVNAFKVKAALRS